jgi:hypothetical protein
VRIQSLFFGLCLFASTAFAAAGEYQQTRDGKTTVWNASPKSGETASWSGSRDKEGYATGFGTVTWYTAQGSVYSEYYGNMVNGKLEGPVNMHTGARTAHAYFADGGRVTAWARGRAPSQMNVPEELVAKRRKAESEPPKPRAERAETKKRTAEKQAATSEQVRPMEQPPKAAVAETKPKPTPEEQRESIEPPQLQTPPPVSRSTPAPIAETTATIPTPEPTQSTSSLMEAPRIAETQESSSAFPTETPAAPTPESTVEDKHETTETTGQSSSTSEEPKKSSVTDLTGPPSSLRDTPPGPPKSETATTARSSGTRGVASLSEDDAIGVADAEARSKGYDLSHYQRPKADYSAVKDKWSLFYTLKDPKTAGGDLQPFSVTVDDKSRRVEIRRNY